MDSLLHSLLRDAVDFAHQAAILLEMHRVGMEPEHDLLRGCKCQFQREVQKRAIVLNSLVTILACP